MKMVLTGLGRLEIQADDRDLKVSDDSLVLTDVLCCAVCRTDAKMWEQGHRDLVFPRVPGHEMVVQDEAGARFMVWPGKSCGICAFCRTSRGNLCEDMKITGFHTDGGFAKKALLPKDSLISPYRTPFPSALPALQSLWAASSMPLKNFRQNKTTGS